MSRRLATVTALSCALLTTPASAYTETGTIRRSSTGGKSVTDTEFRRTCPTAPIVTQGVDAWVFVIPPQFAHGGTAVTLTAPSDAPADLGARVYDSNCQYDRTVTTGSSFGLSMILDVNDRFIEAYTTDGSNVDVTLTVT
jgi:hypothetical protein